jgi:hypothetical protein
MSDAARLACEGMVETIPLRTAEDGSAEAHLLRRVRPPRVDFPAATSRGEQRPAG